MRLQPSISRSNHRIWHALGASLLISTGCSDSTATPDESTGSANAPNGGAAAGSSGSSAGGAALNGGMAAVAGSVSTAGNAAVSGSAAGGSAAGGQGGGSTAGAPQGGRVGDGGGGAAPSGGTGGTPPSTSSTFVPDPAWACGKPDGIVDPTRGELVFRTTLDVGTVRDVGATQYGKRRATDITGGAISGGKLEATFLSGGLDYELTLSDGSVQLEQVGMLKAKDGALIYLRVCGVAPSGQSVVRLVPDFEAANGSSVAWLNTGSFVGTRSLDATGKKLEIAVYDVSMVTGSAPTLKLTAPADAPHQPWDCAKPSGSKGAEVFTESVTLGGSMSVASKHGTRNVIPITGGTISGKLAGTIVNAGADYQLAGSGSTTLDARYVLASSDGEFVVVRNCGPFGALIPQFETRAAGPYAFLNSGAFISSDPGSASGGVKITFYEAK